MTIRGLNLSNSVFSPNIIDSLCKEEQMNDDLILLQDMISQDVVTYTSLIHGLIVQIWSLERSQEILIGHI